MADHIDKKLTFRGMDHSPVVEEHINKQLEKVENILQKESEPILLHVVLDANRTHHHHRVEARLKSPNYELYSDYECPEMYDSIDRVIDTLYRQLLTAKQKLIDQRKDPNKRS